MATKSAQSEPEKVEVIEELLETLDSTLDRVKVLYEQYFLGIQKQAPTQIHTDVERKLRDLQQLQIRNTGLRYRFATLQQKFGSYNNYWRRTLKQIENGTYTRTLAKLGRQAVKSGQEIPEEILAAMPKRMRDQVKRDRDAALAIAKRRQGEPAATDEQALDGDDDGAAFIQEPSAIRRNALSAGGAHFLSEDDGDLDMDAFFREIESEPEPPPPVAVPAPAPARPAPVVAAPPAAPAPPARPAPVRAPSIGGVRTQIPITPLIPTATTTGAIPTIPIPRAVAPASAVTQPMPTSAPGPAARPAPGPHDGTRQIAVPPMPARPAAPPRPGVPAQATPPGAPAIPPPPGSQGTRQVPFVAPSQISRPNPVRPGASIDRPAVPVESMAGPFPRAPTSAPAPAPAAARPVTTPVARPAAESPLRPPPGMSDADVNALYAKYVKAKEAVGDNAGPGAYGKLLKTINAQAPKIMEQYKAKGVEFSVVVKDNQVIIKAKPKT